MAMRQNAYVGICVRCQQTVPALAGIIYKAPCGKRWLCEHLPDGCPPPSTGRITGACGKVTLAITPSATGEPA